MNKHTTNTVRLNITLPAAIGDRLKTTDNRSAFIAESLRQKFAEEDEEKMAELLAEGYKARAAEDKLIAKEFEHTLSDGL